MGNYVLGIVRRVEMQVYFQHVLPLLLNCSALEQAAFHYRRRLALTRARPTPVHGAEARATTM
jgi:hypothetical protein